MTGVENFFDEDEFEEETVPPEVLEDAKRKIAARCAAAGMSFEELNDGSGEVAYKFGFKCGRNTRHVTAWGADALLDFLPIPFEDYSFLTDLEAICSYKGGVIEAGIKPAGVAGSPGMMYAFYRRVFGVAPRKSVESDDFKIVLRSGSDSPVSIEISPSSPQYKALTEFGSRLGLTLKISEVNVTRNENAIELLNNLSGSLLFQLDLLVGIPFILRRERKRPLNRIIRKVDNPAKEHLQFPISEFDSAPLSLYWYGRSADDMPLLQFLAFYQVVEFYFPIYSQSEAQRRLKAILKNPTFRGDKDSDVARLLSAIHVSRSGAFGDERSQLKATILECVDADAIRDFIERDAELKEFYLTGSKSLPFHRLPLGNIGLDLRNDIAERIYDIRCKIVHTKADSRDDSGELLLPFSKEAESLNPDIRLIQHVAQLVLVAGSREFRI